MAMAIQIEMPADEQALTEFVRFHDRVYEYRAARWPASQRFQLHILLGAPPYGAGREIKAFVAREGGAMVARAAAIVDQHYIKHWNEPLGHIVMFEAMPDTSDAVKKMLDEACEWLRSRAMDTARAGSGLMEAPFAIDEYEMLPPSIVRQNPGYYHALLKDAGFETEKGWVDYKIDVTPALVARYESALEAARRAGFSITPLKDLDAKQRVQHFTMIWNDAFKHHWGAAPMPEEEVSGMLRYFGFSGGLETSLIAYRGDEPVGAQMVLPSSTAGVILAPGRAVRESEKLNWLGIAVHESARGRGVNLAMASYAYLELIRQGATYLSYTLVLDDNWPSRRTAEKLGAKVCASYVTYRRKLN
jgi:GNAT superfamily N-acetyltransferase